MKERCIDIMEKTLSAYTFEHIINYFSKVKEEGLTEHGFPRLTADIGILIAHGRRMDLLDTFVEMMEFCCKNIPKVKAANDFSVREIICVLKEIEESGAVSDTYIKRWKKYLSGIEIEACYSVFATSCKDDVKNWALFTALSEYFRREAGLCDNKAFIDLQVKQQKKWLDKNGMYMDHTTGGIHQPMVYDLVPRGLFSLLFDYGYRGEEYQSIDKKLKKAGLLTLKMQSVTGETPFGGRSNQFIHNEAWLVGILEYEAKRYNRLGNKAMAEKFKRAAERSMDVIEKYLAQEEMTHIKNFFPIESGYGCEDYAYFDKYMITVASIIYIAYLICDDSITFKRRKNTATWTAKTSDRFHKVFLKAGDYSAELDLNGDPHYDASGLGRVHYMGAPSAICMSCPCPSNPNYYVDMPNPFALSLSSAIFKNGEWKPGADEDCSYSLTQDYTKDKTAFAELICQFPDGEKITENYALSKNGLEICAEGNGKIGYCLPAFSFDGKEHTKIYAEEKTLTVEYKGYKCVYTTNGIIKALNKTAANRNGYYDMYIAEGNNKLKVTIIISKGDLKKVNK